MKRRPKKKLTQQPWFAAVLLAVGVTVAFSSLRSSLGSGVDDMVGGALSMFDEADPEVVPEEGEPDAGPRRDLVAEFGVYDGNSAVPEFVAALPGDSGDATVPAAPGGEVAKNPGQWVGDPPPQLGIGVVFVGQGSRRAVVDGRVVGVGDRIGEARIDSIERNGLLVEWRGRLLTYDMDSVQPQEYRAVASKLAASADKESQGAGK